MNASPKHIGDSDRPDNIGWTDGGWRMCDGEAESD